MIYVMNKGLFINNFSPFKGFFVQIVLTKK